MNTQYPVEESDSCLESTSTKALIVNPLRVTPDVTVKTAIALMDEAAGGGGGAATYLERQARASCVVVVEAEQVVGIFTERDVVRLWAQAHSLNRLTLAQVMTRPVFTLPESALADPLTVLDVFEREQIRHLPIVDHGDRLVGLVTLNLLAQPIQRKAQRPHPLADQETRYRALMEGAADAILLASPDGQILEANQQATVLLGYSIGELTTLNFNQLHPLEVRPQAIAAFTELEYQPRIQVTNFPCRRKDGSQVIVDITGCAIQINGETIFQGIFHDVSERQAAEQALQASEAKYRLLVETALEGIWLIDADANHVFGNQALYKMLGLSAEEMAGRSLFDFFAPDLHPQITELLKRRRTGIAETNEVPLLRPDGSTVWFLTSSSPIFDEAGNYQGAMSMLTDITQQKQAEAALRESQQLLKTVLDTVPLSVFWKDRNSHYLGANQRFLQDAALQDPAELVGKSDFDLLSNTTEATIYRADDATVMETGEAKLSIIKPLHRPDGTVAWLESNKFPLRNRAGDIVGILGAYQDITKRRQTEIDLQNLTDRLTLALQAGGFGTWDWDGANEVNWDEQMYVIYGVKNNGERAIYSTWHNGLHPEDRDRVIALLYAAFRGEAVYDTEFRILRPDGELRWIQAIAEVQVDPQGKPIRMVGLNQDITDRKQAEQDLYESRAKFQRLVDDIGDKFVIFSRTPESVTYVSGGFEAIFGIPGESILGKPWIDPVDWSPDSLESALTDIEAMLAAKIGTQELELRFTRPDGDVREVRVIQHPVWDEAGNLLAIEGLAEDITEQKAVETELRRINAELERATRLKDEFLANMSHELRTPLNAILGITEGLQDEVFGSINPRQLKALTTVETSASHLLSLINDILDVAKIEAGQVTLECAPVSVEPLCLSSLAFVKQQALNKHIQLKIQIAPHLPDIWGDELRIRQVLLNLLTNAVKFTDEGGTVTLSVTGVPGATAADPPSLHIAITDTGMGIAPENIPKLFKPFVQIDGSLNRKHMGTGLGLALVKQIVDLHGGRIGLTSEIGVGSCFTVDLPYPHQTPLVPAPAAISRTSEAVDHGPLLCQIPLVLLAEDNPANRLTLSSYLEGKGYRLMVAHDGLEAIDMTLSHRPDVIVMDIQMPGVDGLEAIQRIRQHPDFQTVPIIALTALAMDGDREKCLEAGANHYFSKPVKIKQLDLAIRELLAERFPQNPIG